MKANFGCETNSFLAGNTATAGQNCFFVNCRYKTYEILRKQRFFREQIRSKSSAQPPRSLLFLGYVLYIFTMSGFLSKCTAGKFILGKLLRQSHKNQTQKTKFCRKMLQKSYFLKKKFFLIFARFLKKKKQYLSFRSMYRKLTICKVFAFYA